MSFFSPNMRLGRSHFLRREQEDTPTLLEYSPWMLNFLVKTLVSENYIFMKKQHDQKKCDENLKLENRRMFEV